MRTGSLIRFAIYYQCAWGVILPITVRRFPGTSRLSFNLKRTRHGAAAYLRKEYGPQEGEARRPTAGITKPWTLVTSAPWWWSRYLAFWRDPMGHDPHLIFTLAKRRLRLDQTGNSRIPWQASTPSHRPTHAQLAGAAGLSCRLGPSYCITDGPPVPSIGGLPERTAPLLPLLLAGSDSYLRAHQRANPPSHPPGMAISDLSLIPRPPNVGVCRCRSPSLRR